jgi:hypothetical protein
MDCPPCQTMAGEEEQFIADMAAQGITVHVVTLLAPSLMNVVGETTQGNLNTWIDNFELKAPVLADRGWGLAMFEQVIALDQIGYPSWVVVNPDLVVLDYASGYDNFVTPKQIIEADAP